MITLKKKDWNRIHSQIKQDYHATPSVWLVRKTTKRVLGFTVRYDEMTWCAKEGYSNLVYLDFFDDQKETVFILKYL